MDVKVTAKTGFAHGKLNLKRGDEATVSEATAKDLEKAGLVSIGSAPGDPGGKAPARSSKGASKRGQQKTDNGLVTQSGGSAPNSEDNDDNAGTGSGEGSGVGEGTGASADGTGGGSQ